MKMQDKNTEGATHLAAPEMRGSDRSEWVAPELRVLPIGQTENTTLSGSGDGAVFPETLVS